MDVLRRLRYTPARDSSRTGAEQKEALRSPILRGADKALSEALDQLRAGVPLNWSQVEDDPELATLDYLQRAAQMSREDATGVVATQLRQNLIETLSARMPYPRAKPVAPVPKPLAGFSESVHVLTQAEEDIPPLVSDLPRKLAIVLGAAVIFFVAYLGISSYIQADSKLKFRWIEVRQDGKLISRRDQSSGTAIANCPATAPGSDTTTNFVPRAGLKDAQSAVSFPLVQLPFALTTPSAYTLQFIDTAVAFCGAAQPQTGNRGAIALMDYQASHRIPGATAPPGTGWPTGYVNEVTQLAVFQQESLPADIDVSSGTWEEVRVGDIHGIYRQGGAYSDPAGNVSLGSVSVMVVEQGDVVLTFVGNSERGITRDMLISLLGNITIQQGTTEGSTPAVTPGTPSAPGTPTAGPLSFTWIGAHVSEQVLFKPQPPAGWQPPQCQSTSRTEAQAPIAYTELDSIAAAQADVGFPIWSAHTSVPAPATLLQNNGQQVTQPITYTLQLDRIAVGPCDGSVPQQGDTYAAVALHYTTAMLTAGQSPAGGPDLAIFQSARRTTDIDLAGGDWKELEKGSARGVLWSGDNYTDPSGENWKGSVRVLVVERGDVVFTLVSQTSEELLMRLLTQLGSQPPLRLMQRGTSKVRN